MKKYIKRLDLELHGFKTELEADKSGITELIEKSNNLINKICFVVCNELFLENKNYIYYLIMIISFKLYIFVI